MPQIGPLELLTVAAVALIVFGPQRLPEIARTIGKTLSELRRQANEIRGEFATSFDETPIAPTDSELREQETAHVETEPAEHGIEIETDIAAGVQGPPDTSGDEKASS